MVAGWVGCVLFYVGAAIKCTQAQPVHRIAGKLSSTREHLWHHTKA